MDTIIFNEIEDSSYSKSEFIRSAIHNVLKNENSFNELISQEAFINQMLIEFLEAMLNEIDEKKKQLINENQKILDDYYRMKVESSETDSYDQNTIDAINAIKGIIERGCTVDMRMIRFNAKRCYRSTDNFLKILRKENVKI